MGDPYAGARAELSRRFYITDQYPLVKYEWSGGDMIYEGRNKNASAADGDADWLIVKNTYDGSHQITQQKALTGAWTGKEGLGW